MNPTKHTYMFFIWSQIKQTYYHLDVKRDVYRVLRFLIFLGTGHYLSPEGGGGGAFGGDH